MSIKKGDIFMLDFYSPDPGNNLHTIRYTFMLDDFVGHVAFAVGGNCRGSSILKADFLEFDSQEDIDRYTKNDCDFTYHPGAEIYSAVFKDKMGNTCYFEGDERDFQNHIVSIEFVDVKKEE